MIAYIETQLAAWGRWAIRAASRTHGFPPVCPMFREMKFSHVYGSSVPFGVSEYVDDTDLAVRRLDEADRELCVRRYQFRWSAEEIASEFGISRATVFRRIDQIHFELIGHLNDIAAEQEMPRRPVAQMTANCC